MLTITPEWTMVPQQPQEWQLWTGEASTGMPKTLKRHCTCSIVTIMFTPADRSKLSSFILCSGVAA
jgi:hypothetical protein